MGDLNKGRSSKWRWIVVPAAFINMVIHASLNYNCGVLNDAVLETYDTDAVQSSWLMSYYCALFALAAPLASAAILLTDCRTIVIISGILGLAGFASSSLVRSLPVLYLTLGLSGFAQCLCQTGSVLTLSYYFPDNLPLVNGVCLAGSGMGSFIHPVLTQTLLDTYGLDGTMLLLGSMAFHSTCLGMLFRPSPLEIKSKVFLTKRDQSKWKIICSKIIPPADIFKIPAFLVLIPTMGFYSVAFQSMVVILPSYIKRHVGLRIQQGSVAAMLLGGGSVASRLLSGAAASDKNVGEAMLFVGMSGLWSVLSFCGKLIMEFYHGVFVFSFFFGLYAGGLISLGNSLTMEIVGMERSAHAYGLIMFVYGIAGFTGPPLISLIVEIQGSDMLFTTCGALCLLISALALLMTHLQKFSNTATPSVKDTLKELNAARDMSFYVFEDVENGKDNDSVLLPRGTLRELKTIPDEDNVDDGVVKGDKRNADEVLDNHVTISSPSVKDDVQRCLL